MTKQMRIDIVSDVVCPWCIVGYRRLEKALSQFEEIDFDIHWQPFELNHNMVAEGENLREHLMAKYGITKEDSVQARNNLTNISANLDFEMNFTDEMRIYNTFAAHQLLHWAGETSDKQTALKQALFTTYFTNNQDISDPSVLLEVIEQVDLDVNDAKEVLENKTYETDVRTIQQKWIQAGIQGVPAVIFNEKHLVSGAQETDTFVQVIQQLT